TKDMIATMHQNPIIMAIANPDREIMTEAAIEEGDIVIGTSRSYYPNQVNNVLACLLIYRGSLDVRATNINARMKQAAVSAIAKLITDEELKPGYVIPSPFDHRVAPHVAAAVAKAAMETGVAQISVEPEEIRKRTLKIAEISKGEDDSD